MFEGHAAWADPVWLPALADGRRKPESAAADASRLRVLPEAFSHGFIDAVANKRVS